jgi:molybdopterin synthase sulfur carrier subunit
VQVRVRAFATLRDALGANETAVTLDDDAAVADALRTLEADHDGLAGELLADGEIPSTLTVLRNGERVPADDPNTVALVDGDELVLAPPVTGG